MSNRRLLLIIIGLSLLAFLVIVGLILLGVFVISAIRPTQPITFISPTPAAVSFPTSTPTPERQTQTALAYFVNFQRAPQECNRVFSVQRVIQSTQAVARAALEELLKGPTAQEAQQGFTTSIPQGVVIQDLVIENGIARVDFNEALQQGVGGSCRVAAIRAQITQTLQQFTSVSQVIISINGRTEDILQP